MSLQPRNASSLGGLLQSLVISLSPQQLLKVPTQPIALIGGPPKGFANLLRTIIASYEFGTTPYTPGTPSTFYPSLEGNPSPCAFYYGGPSRMGILGGQSADPSWWQSFKITAVAAASGGNTTYTCSGLAAIPANSLVGFGVQPTGCTNAANNQPATIVSHSTTAIVVNNLSGVAEGSPPAGASMGVFAPLALVGGGGGTVDLGGLLAQPVSTVLGWTIAGWNFPAPEVDSAALYLGSPQTGLVVPVNFSAGDGSLLVTLEYLQVGL